MITALAVSLAIIVYLFLRVFASFLEILLGNYLKNNSKSKD